MNRTQTRQKLLRVLAAKPDGEVHDILACAAVILAVRRDMTGGEVFRWYAEHAEEIEEADESAWPSMASLARQAWLHNVDVYG